MADAIETGSVLEAVRGDADGYVLGFRRDGASREVRARQVILALPFTLLRKVRLDVELPAVKRRAIDRLAYGSNAKLMIGYDRRVWREHGANGASMSDLAYQTTWETSRKQAGGAGVLTNFTGGRHGIELGTGTPKQQADTATAALEQVFPGVVAARAGMREARFHWPSHPWSARQLRLLRPRRLDDLARRDRRIGRRPAFRRRALRTGDPGLHGGRLRIGGDRGGRGARRARDECDSSRGLTRLASICLIPNVFVPPGLVLQCSVQNV